MRDPSNQKTSNHKMSKFNTKLKDKLERLERSNLYKIKEEKASSEVSQISKVMYFFIIINLNKYIEESKIYS